MSAFSGAQPGRRQRVLAGIGSAVAAAAIVASITMWIVPAPSDRDTAAVSVMPPARHPQPTVHRRPPPAIDFARFTTVKMADYSTYESYDRSAVQFTTETGIRCRIDTVLNEEPGLNSIYCWGSSPAMPADFNEAHVSLSSHVSLDTASSVFSDFSYTDPADFIKGQEAYLDSQTAAIRQVDPTSYRTLAPMQKILITRAEIPLGRFGVHRSDPARTQAICAVDDQRSLMCDLQQHGARHGFVIAHSEQFAY